MSSTASRNARRTQPPPVPPSVAGPKVTRSRRRLLAGLLGSILFVGFLLLGVFPTRTYLTQKTATSDARAELSDLEARNRLLDRRIARLKTPAEIERIAREQYGLVRPGEVAYAILPPPPPPVRLPEVWPFVDAVDQLNR